jgi:hypothetical protein
MTGAILVTIGVAGELFFTFEASKVETKLRDNNHQIVAILTKEAGDAKGSAKDAATSAHSAEGDAEQARTDAGDAKSLSRGARSEADSLTSEIKSANDKAADAVSRLAGAEQQLADATQREANAEEELKRIKTPRSISHEDALRKSLSAFRGTKYVFLSVFQDTDSTTLIRSIDDLLQKSGWVRDTPVEGFPSLSYKTNGKEDFSVPVGISQGIQISTESPEELGVIQSRTDAEQPKYLQAALVLRADLSASIVPANEGNVGKNIHVDKGASTTIRIAVGSKPIE